MSGRVTRDCACPRARHQHGTLGGYKADLCRCFHCRVAHSRACAAYKAGQSGSDTVWLHRAGTIRRLQALAVVGWSDTQLGARLGVTKQAVQNLRARAGEPILLATAARVAELYDALWNVTPVARGAERTRREATRRAWRPPLAWDDDTIDIPQTVNTRSVGYTDGLHANVTARRIPRYIDEIAVERAMRGDPVRLTMAERSEAHARLNRMGLSATEIAERLGTTKRTVVRRRSAA